MARRGAQTALSNARRTAPELDAPQRSWQERAYRGFLRVRIALAGRDQAAQAVVDVEPPGARAVAVALAGGNQTNVREAELRLAALAGDLEDDVGAVPLGLALDELEPGVRDMPDDLLPPHELGDLLRTAVKAFVAVGELGAELVGAPLDFSRPPSANVV